MGATWMFVFINDEVGYQQLGKKFVGDGSIGINDIYQGMSMKKERDQGRYSNPFSNILL